MGMDKENEIDASPQPDKVISVDDMTDEELGKIIGSEIYLAEANGRSKNRYYNHVDLTDEERAAIVKLVIEVWRIKELPDLLNVAKEAGRRFEEEINTNVRLHAKFNTDERAAIDALKGNVIKILTPRRLPALPACAHDYPERAIYSLVEIKKMEKPKPTPPSPYGNLL